MTSVTVHLTPKEKKAAISMALEGGMEPAEVFKAVTANVYGATARRKLIVEWGEKMGLDASDSLHKAVEAGLIPSSHPPRVEKGKPPQKTQDSTSG
jgi:hypothetical protein